MLNNSDGTVTYRDPLDSSIQYKYDDGQCPHDINNLTETSLFCLSVSEPFSKVLALMSGQLYACLFFVETFTLCNALF